MLAIVIMYKLWNLKTRTDLERPTIKVDSEALLFMTYKYFLIVVTWKRKPGVHRNGTIFYKCPASCDAYDIDIIDIDMRDVTAAFSGIE